MAPGVELRSRIDPQWGNPQRVPGVQAEWQPKEPVDRSPVEGIDGFDGKHPSVGNRTIVTPGASGYNS